MPARRSTPQFLRLTKICHCCGGWCCALYKGRCSECTRELQGGPINTATLHFTGNHVPLKSHDDDLDAYHTPYDPDR